ncbi:hypothetical protein PARPLA_02157 [Rhodobacteraceae bacterium THAF1]|nr:hypothetical protein FIU81_04190 [Palleronia sp. THAF1]VDC25703.1 hypothetical protein PARPLA_02157 [Rhodobacteraceae bacterium THAF1]
MVQVLKDLRAFAELNGMQSLAQKLDEASDVADRTLRVTDEPKGMGHRRYGAEPRSTDREVRRDH